MFTELFANTIKLAKLTVLTAYSQILVNVFVEIIIQYIVIIEKKLCQHKMYYLLMFMSNRYR